MLNLKKELTALAIMKYGFIQSMVELTLGLVRGEIWTLTQVKKYGGFLADT